jgi:Rieske Fe-S protein
VDISSMANVGSQTTVNGVLFFRVAAGAAASSFVATEALCPHQGGTLTWQQNNNRIQCGTHQATYSAAGAVTGNPNDGGATRALKIYAVTLTGTTLTATKS